MIPLILTLLTLLCFYNFYWKRRNFPPGPTPWPIIGNVLSLRKVKRIEEKFLEWKKQYGDIYTLWLGETPMVTINSYEALEKHIIKDGENFTGRMEQKVLQQLTKGGTYGVFDTVGEVWKEQRRFALKAFRDNGMGKDKMERRIIDEINYIFEKVEVEIDNKVEEIDILKICDIAVGSVINAVISGYRFTIDNREEEFRKIKRATTEVMDSAGEILTSLVLFNPALLKVPYISRSGNLMIEDMKLILQFLEEKVEKHLELNDYSQEFEPEDFMDSFLLEKFRLDQQDAYHTFSNKQLASVCFDLWFAGQETTISTLMWAISYLINHDDCQQKLHNELDSVIGSKRIIEISDRPNLPYTMAVITETQRTANLLGLNLPRTNTKDIEMAGVMVPKDTPIVPQISVIMYDPKVFKDPFTFNPERFIVNGKFKPMEQVIPFSAGKRACLGEGLAKMELFLFLANMFNHYKFSSGKVKPSMNKPCSNAFSTENFTCKIERRY